MTVLVSETIRWEKEKALKGKAKKISTGGTYPHIEF